MHRRRRTHGRHRRAPREWPYIVVIAAVTAAFLAWLWLTPAEQAPPTPDGPLCVAWSWVDDAGRRWWGCR